MASSESGFGLHITVWVDPKDVGLFFESLRPAYEKIVAEPECTFFEVYQSPDNPGEICWVEHWSRSTDWFFKEQLTKDYYKPYLSATEGLFLKPREIKIYNRVAGYSYSA